MSKFRLPDTWPFPIVICLLLVFVWWFWTQDKTPISNTYPTVNSADSVPASTY